MSKCIACSGCNLSACVYGAWPSHRGPTSRLGIRSVQLFDPYLYCLLCVCNVMIHKSVHDCEGSKRGWIHLPLLQ